MSMSESPPSPSHETPSISESPPSKAKCSIRSLVPHFKAKHSTISKPKPKANAKSLKDNGHKGASSSGITNHHDDHGGASAVYELIDHDLREYMDHVNTQIDQAYEKLQQLKTSGSSSETELDELKKLKKVVAKLKSQIPSQHKIRAVDSNLRHWPDINKPSNEMMPNLYKEPKFEHIIEPQDLQGALDRLPYEVNCCLLCFYMFPAMTILKRRFVIYWWIGDGLVFLHKFKNEIQGISDEDIGNDLFDVLIAEGFIKPVYQKRSLVPDSGRISHSIHSALRIKADDYHAQRTIYTLGQDNQRLSPKNKYVINVDNSIVNGGTETFEEMKHIKIVYLGRWQSSATHHIEVADTKILHGLRNMKNLTFLSLQGISLITELPSFITELTDLEILDLRACHNLEVIPNGIGSLQRLTHLDMSECYFLENMPKSIADLSNLEVLKGFFIGDSNSCTLDDLSGLPKLRKLNIYTNVKDFPRESHLHALQRFTALQKLTISWGGRFSPGENDASNQAKDYAIESSASSIIHPGIEGHVKNKEDSTRKAPTKEKPPRALPSKLQKLDLQGFRGTSLPSWLRPANLKQLKKLYVRGGQLRDLGQFLELRKEDKWTVEILSLKYLHELEIKWEKLRVLFPKLIYLHKVGCPKLINFPLDECWVGELNKRSFFSSQGLHPN